MRILCRHGHIAFYQSYAGEIARFMEFFGVELIREGEFYTFLKLAGAPKYSIAGMPYLGLPAKVTFEGEPWEILKANGYVYQIATGLIVPKESILYTFTPEQTGYYYLWDGPLIQPGAWAEGNQVLSWDAMYDDEMVLTKVSELSYG